MHLVLRLRGGGTHYQQKFVGQNGAIYEITVADQVNKLSVLKSLLAKTTGYQVE